MSLMQLYRCASCGSTNFHFARSDDAEQRAIFFLKREPNAGKPAPAASRLYSTTRRISA
jgi:hypothetical protein